MTRVLSCLALIILLVPVTFVHGPQPVAPVEDQAISLEPVAFHSSDSERTRLGRLEFLAGWRMTSKNSNFGGISSMVMLKKNRFLMLSDRGNLIGFALDEKGNRALRPFIAPLPGGPAPPNEHARRNWDAESIASDPETGQFWVGFEFWHGIWRYSRSLKRAEMEHRVPRMQDWPGNGGAEALLKLGDGRFLVFSESADFSKGGNEALIFNGDPAEPDSKMSAFGYRPPVGYRITDAALLPDGKALLLFRRFSALTGFSAILSIGDPNEVQEGKIWTSQKIAELKPPFTVDNMEALAVTRQGEETVVWIASDDNFLPVQDSLLMKFKLQSGKKKRKPKTEAEKEKAGTKPGFSSLPDAQADQ